MKKKCKYCSKLFSPATGRVGNGFCSPNCFYNKKNGKPLKLQENIEVFEAPKHVKKIKFKVCKPMKEKEKPERDEKYKQFIREFPCIVCNFEKTHAHHVETHGLSTKGSDLSCVPLCDAHHVSNSDSFHKIGLDKFEKTHNIDLDKEQIRFLRIYINKLKEKK